MKKKKLMLPMYCNKCGKEPIKENKDGWNVIKLDCSCGGMIVMDYTKPYHE